MCCGRSWRSPRAISRIFGCDGGQVANLAVGLVEEYRRPVLVPMTLVNPGYFGEIFSTLKDAGIDVHHFFLKVSREVSEKRIDGRIHGPGDPEREDRVRRWCKDRIEPCMAAADTLPSDTVFRDGELTSQPPTSTRRSGSPAARQPTPPS